MIKILHTADLHLDQDAGERWAALEELLALAKREEISALVIAGDLFECAGAAEMMRTELRAAFDGCGFKTIILPGNHDHRAYRSGLYFGDNVNVIQDWREPVHLGETALWGLPHDYVGPTHLAARLREMGSLMDPEQENILLFHGELLDTFFSRRDMGKEGEQRYMPARLAFFDPLPVRYILAGHFHSRFAVWQTPGGRLFVYPGSPVSVTRRETGRRRANLLLAGETPREIALDSFHFEELVITLDPLTKQDPLLELDHKMADLHSSAGILLTVEGLFDGAFFNLDETGLVSAIKEKTAGRYTPEPTFNFVDVSHILEDDLFKKMKGVLEESGYPLWLKEEVEEMIIQAFRRIKQCS